MTTPKLIISVIITELLLHFGYYHPYILLYLIPGLYTLWLGITEDETEFKEIPMFKKIVVCLFILILSPSTLIAFFCGPEDLLRGRLIKDLKAATSNKYFHLRLPWASGPRSQNEKQMAK